MAKVILKPMAGPDSPIYQRGIHIGAPIRRSHHQAKLPDPEIVYDSDRLRGDLDFMCTVEWSWSSYHERIESYYFGVTKDEYELWSHYNDESTGNRNWCCCAVAEKSAVPIARAPAWLLETLWRHESAERSIGLFDMVSEEGLLEQDEVIQIGKAVWPE
jgi:hypothetical protein